MQPSAISLSAETVSFGLSTRFTRCYASKDYRRYTGVEACGSVITLFVIIVRASCHVHSWAILSVCGP